MEKQEYSGSTDNPESLVPSPNSSAPDIYSETESASRNSLELEAKGPALAQRLAAAFREGVASARPDYEKRPDLEIPPRARKISQKPSHAGILDRVVKEGGSAATVAGNTAASVLGGFAQLVKKAPALTQKYANAFREGAASVKPGERRVQREEGPSAAREKGTPVDGRVILDRMIKAGESAAGFVREAVSVVKPGETIGARQKIRLNQKKINQLYIDIGSEAARAWNSGQVETEKLAALLAERLKQEEEMLNLQAELTQVAAAGETAARRPQKVKKATASTPVTDQTGQADSHVAESGPGATPGETVYHFDALEAVHSAVDRMPEETLPQPENIADVAPDAGVAHMSVSETPESLIAPENNVEAETAPSEESDGGAESALEPAIAIDSWQASFMLEESGSAVGLELPEELEVSRQQSGDGPRDAVAMARPVNAKQ